MIFCKRLFDKLKYIRFVELSSVFLILVNWLLFVIKIIIDFNFVGCEKIWLVKLLYESF